MFRIALLISVALVAAGCAFTEPRGMPLGQQSFADYQIQAKAWIQQHRQYQGRDIEAETAWNAPQEWRPDGQARKGMLLVHGLGDSPWSFADLGPAFAARGFLTRSILLPGHGTKPEDLLSVSVNDWRRVLREQVRILQGEVGDVYLGGFSTGANLVLEYALEHSDIKGLALFSPAVKARSTYIFLAPLAAILTDWILEPREGRPLQTPFRYLLAPTNAFAQFYHTSTAVSLALREQSYDRPVFVALAERDSVVNARYVLDTFGSSFTHPASRLVWYGNLAPDARLSARVISRPDRLPEWRISSFSHMAVLFSPENKAYGPDGTQRLCWNGQEPRDFGLCLEGGEVWYSSWGYREPGKVHARLTFNPYFSWQNAVMFDVLEDGRGLGVVTSPDRPCEPRDR